MKKPTPQPRSWKPQHTRPAVPKNKRITTRPSNPFYHTNRWRMHSERFREENPFCIDCRAEGVRTPAKVCDHDPPLEVQLRNGGDGYDVTQQKPRCFKHHQAKGSKDRNRIKE